MDETEIVRALAALGQPHRLRIFRALVIAGREGRTPGVLSQLLAIPPATLSFHLKELTASGLVSQSRSSRYLVYRAAFERVNALLGYLTDNCCEGDPCLEAAATGCEC